MVKDIPIDIPIIRKSINASLFGMSEGNSNNFDCLCEAINYCKVNNINKLIIPEGQYKFATPQPILFENLQDFMLDAQGSEFVFSQVADYIHIKDCNRLVIKSLKVDWDWSLKRLGTLARIAHFKCNDYFDLEFFEVNWLDDNLVMDIMNAFDPITLTPGREDGREYGLKFLKFQRQSDNVFRFFVNNNTEYTTLAVGDIYLVRHFKYEANAFIILDSTHISFEDITIFSVPGFGFGLDGDCQHFRLKGCKICLKPNTARRVTATADGFHVRQSQGNIVVEDCDFSFMGDDAVNIHDNNGVSLKKVNSHCLNVKNISRHLHYHKEDIIEFRNMDLSPMNLFAAITETAFSAEDEILLTFDKEVPEEAIIFNRRYDSSNYIIRNNYFHENRARGVLIHNSNGIIQNNVFYKNQGSAIQIETGIHYNRGWSEGTGVEDLLVQNNVFDTCDVSDWNHGVIYISSYLPDGRTTFPIFKNIRFLKNHFINVPNRSFFIASSKEVIIRGNTFSNPDSRIRNKDKRNSIWIEKCSEIYIEENKIDKSAYICKEFIECEADSVEQIIVQNTKFS